MKTCIFIETSNPKTPEYVFVDMLCKKYIGQGKYRIVCVGGYTNLKPRSNTKTSTSNEIKILEKEFKTAFDECSKFIILFDADKDFAKRKILIDTWVKEHQQIIQKEYDIFLFPDNRSNGNFETLLKGIVNDKHRKIFCCLDAMQNCLKKEGYGNYHPDLKQKIYVYLTCLVDKEYKIKSNDYLFKHKEYWNLNHPDLQELEKFLEKYSTQ